MKKTRFELAALANEILRRYVDTDPTASNPLPMVQKALAACNELVEIEKSYERTTKKEGASPQKIDKAIDEWKQRHASFFDDSKAFGKLLVKHGAKIERIAAVINELQSLERLMTSIDNRLEKIQAGLDTSLKEEAA